jgi:hypothetical protein
VRPALRYCDSAFAFHGGTEMTLDQIVAEVGRLGAPLVLLTGGEPMLQRELPELARRLLERRVPRDDRNFGRPSAGSLPDGRRARHRRQDAGSGSRTATAGAAARSCGLATR